MLASSPASILNHNRPVLGIPRRFTAMEMATAAQQEAAVAADRHDRRVGPGDLGAERRGVTPAQRALVARREEGARLVGRIGEAGGVAHLRQLIDQDAVVGQRLADGVEIGELRRELVVHRSSSAGALVSATASARPLRLALCVASLTASAFKVAVASPTMPISGLRWRSSSSLSTSMRMILQRRRRCPSPLLRLQARADGQHDIGLAPEAIAGRHGRPTARCRPSKRPGPSCRSCTGASSISAIAPDVLARALRAAADHDHRTLAPAQQLGGALDGVLVDRAGVGLRRRREQPTGALRPQVSMAHSSPTGRRRPDSRRRNASFTSPGASAGAWMRSAHLVRPRMIDELVGQLVQQADIAADHRPAGSGRSSASTGAFTA